jgi:hypothetical protein
MSMNQILANFYNTNGAAEKTASAEDHEKAAQYELFTKIAHANNIDLSKLNDTQIAELYSKTFDKTAGEMPPQFAAHAKGKEDKEGEKGEHHEIEEKAKKEHEEKKEAAAKMVEADFLGRQMAHAYVQELQKIAEAKAASAGGTTAATTAANGEWKVELPKVASAIDTLAMHRAFAMVQEFNAGAAEHNKTAAAKDQLGFINEKEAAEKIAQVHTKGLNDSIKVASAPDHKAAVEVRALETLEAAGYPVDWKQ